MLNDKLNEWCVRTGKTTADFAREAGVSYDILRRWCRGEATPRPRRFRLLGELLGVDPMELAAAIALDAGRRRAKRAGTDGNSAIAGDMALPGGCATPDVSR